MLHSYFFLSLSNDNYFLNANLSEKFIAEYCNFSRAIFREKLKSCLFNDAIIFSSEEEILNFIDMRSKFYNNM